MWGGLIQVRASVWTMHHHKNEWPGPIYKNSSHVKFPQSSSFCLSSFMTDLEIITPAPCAVPCIDLAQGIETHPKTRQGGMAKLLCGNPPCGRKDSFWFSLAAMLPPPNNTWYCVFLSLFLFLCYIIFFILQYSMFILLYIYLRFLQSYISCEILSLSCHLITVFNDLQYKW